MLRKRWRQAPKKTPKKRQAAMYTWWASPPGPPYSQGDENDACWMEGWKCVWGVACGPTAPTHLEMSGLQWAWAGWRERANGHGLDGGSGESGGLRGPYLDRASGNGRTSAELSQGGGEADAACHGITPFVAMQSPCTSPVFPVPPNMYPTASDLQTALPRHLS